MLAFILAAAALTPAPPAQAPAPPAAPAAPAAEIDFTGQTTADARLIWDAMQEVMRFSSGHALKCDRVTAVKASIQPEGWQPADPNFRVALPGARYERWEVAQCGRVVPFLVTFWTVKGTSEFSVAHPFPGEPVKPAKP